MKLELNKQKNLKHREYIKTAWNNQGNTKTQGRISKRTENGCNIYMRVIREEETHGKQNQMH